MTYVTLDTLEKFFFQEVVIGPETRFVVCRCAMMVRLNCTIKNLLTIFADYAKFKVDRNK